MPVCRDLSARACVVCMTVVQELGLGQYSLSGDSSQSSKCLPHVHMHLIIIMVTFILLDWGIAVDSVLVSTSPLWSYAEGITVNVCT